MSKRTRRTFTAEYKAEVVALVKKSGKTAERIARELGLTSSSVRKWVKDADAEFERGNRKPTGESEREELLRLRKELQQVRMERDFLKKAAAFFAKESQ